MSKTAVVTGAGTGVGRAVAIDLAKRGYNVALLGRTEATLAEAIELAGKTTGNLLAIRCDVSVDADVRSMGKQVRAELGPVSVLVSSAGINFPQRHLRDIPIENYRKTLDVNLSGAFLVIQEFLADMRTAGGGTIVNVASDAGLIANRFSGVAYAAAKFGLVGLTDAINAEERNNGIRACAVCPGEIDTPLLDKRPVKPSAERRTKMLTAEDVSACVMLAIDLPDRATVEQIFVRPREIG